MLEHSHSEPTPPARTVVLGSRGFVGSAIVERLRRESADVLGLSSSDLDLTRADASAQLRGQLSAGDAVVFVSAIAPCRDAATLIANLQMVEHAVDALRESPIEHLVYISSDAVYRDEVGVVSEQSCASPESLHGVMHLARERVLATSLDVPLAILRPSLLYGARDPHSGYGPNRFRRTAAADRKISLFGQGEELRDHVFIDDVAELVAQVLGRRSHGVLNLVTGRSTSFGEIADKIADLHGDGVEIENLPRGGPITHRHFDATALQKSFPAFCPTPIDEGLRQVHAQIGASQAG